VDRFPDKLRQAIHEKRCKSADVAKDTGISPSVLSRYLSGRNKPSSENIIAISHYLNVSPDWLLSSSDAPDLTKKSKVMSSVTEPLHKTIEVQDKLIKNLEKQLADSEKLQDQTKTPRGYFVPKDTLKILFDLIDQLGSYGAIAFGLGSYDETNKDHKWIFSEMDRLDAEINTIRSLYFSEKDIQNKKLANMKRLSYRSPKTSKGGRPRKK
jgi:transcriptional regulator with XRE-family HTH domain